MINKQNLVGKTKEELRQIIEDIGEPSFRADQLHSWIYIKSAECFDEMTNVSKKLKEKLNEKLCITNNKIVDKQISQDGTIKYLIEFADGNKAETVLMRFDNRSNLTACVSSQIGCAVNCKFCATGKQGFIRNLEVSEIVDQVLQIQRDRKVKVSNIVFMGQGEPFLNYDNLCSSISILNTAMEISTRRITISTAGIIPKILQIAKDFPQCTLAVSIHAPDSKIRQKLIPLEFKYSLTNIIDCLKEYNKITNRRVTIEYVMIKDINDKPEDAKKLNQLLQTLHCNINLIPYNNIESENESDFKTPEVNKIKMFKYILELSGKKVTMRLKRGNDISAACGQLSGKN